MFVTVGPRLLSPLSVIVYRTAPSHSALPLLLPHLEGPLLARARELGQGFGAKMAPKMVSLWLWPRVWALTPGTLSDPLTLPGSDRRL